VCQFVGYQSRTSVPSNFDSDYAYALGATAVALASHGHSGYMATVSDLAKPVTDWRVGGVPLTAMMQLPLGAERPVIPPQRVLLNDAAFQAWCQTRDSCAVEECFESPGPIQLSGPSADRITNTVASKHSYLRDHQRLQQMLSMVSDKTRPGSDPRRVTIAAKSLEALNLILDEL